MCLCQFQEKQVSSLLCAWHPSFTGPCRGLYQGQRQSSRDGIGNCQAGGDGISLTIRMAYRKLEKTSCRFGEKSCIMDRSEVWWILQLLFQKGDWKTHVSLIQLWPGSKEGGGKRPHGSNPILCQGAWNNMVWCSVLLFFIQQCSSFHKKCSVNWTQGLLLNLNYPLLYWVAPNYEEFQQLDDSNTKTWPNNPNQSPESSFSHPFPNLFSEDISKVVNLVTLIVIVAENIQFWTKILSWGAFRWAQKLGFGRCGEKYHWSEETTGGAWLPKNDDTGRVIHKEKSGGMRLMMMTSTMVMPSLGVLNPTNFYDFMPIGWDEWIQGIFEV